MSENIYSGFENPENQDGKLNIEKTPNIAGSEAEIVPELSPEEVKAAQSVDSAKYQETLADARSFKTPAEIDKELDKLNKQLKGVEADEKSMLSHSNWGFNGGYSSPGREPKAFVGKYEGLDEVVGAMDVLREKHSDKGEREKGFFGWLSGERVKKEPEIKDDAWYPIYRSLESAGYDQATTEKNVNNPYNWTRDLPWYSESNLGELTNAPEAEIRKACDFANADSKKVEAVFDFLSQNKPEFLKTPYYQEKIAAFNDQHPEIVSAKGYDKLLVSKEEILDIPFSVKTAMNADGLQEKINTLNAEKGKLEISNVAKPAA
jgi:hypothetical protein